MVSVVEFHGRAVERLQKYRDNPGTLRALQFARYALDPRKIVNNKDKRPRTHQPKIAKYAERSHKPHQMHLQHRDNCIRVLEILIKRCDFKTLQCKYINPARNIRRDLYVAELARLLELSCRTISRVLSSLTRARFILRKGLTGISLSLNLFREMELDITFQRLQKMLMGLGKKGDYKGPLKKNGNSWKTQYAKRTEPGSVTDKHPAYVVNEPVVAAVPKTEDQLARGNQFLNGLKGRRRRQ